MRGPRGEGEGGGGWGIFGDACCGFWSAASTRLLSAPPGRRLLHECLVSTLILPGMYLTYHHATRR